MKKGKTSKIIGFKNTKISYGTVDSFEMKSLYLNIQSWVEPKYESHNWNRVVLNTSRAIKHTILNNLNKKIYKDKFIVDLDLRSSGLTLKKKSFLNLEINLYLSEVIDFKDSIIKESLKDLSRHIINQNFNKNQHFDFYLTKKNSHTKV